MYSRLIWFEKDFSDDMKREFLQALITKKTLMAAQDSNSCRVLTEVEATASSRHGPSMAIRKLHPLPFPRKRPRQNRSTV
jgi:hypothetical protein